VIWKCWREDTEGLFVPLLITKCWCNDSSVGNVKVYIRSSQPRSCKSWFCILSFNQNTKIISSGTFQLTQGIMKFSGLDKCRGMIYSSIHQHNNIWLEIKLVAQLSWYIRWSRINRLNEKWIDCADPDQDFSSKNTPKWFCLANASIPHKLLGQKLQGCPL